MFRFAPTTPGTTRTSRRRPGPGRSTRSLSGVSASEAIERGTSGWTGRPLSCAPSRSGYARVRQGQPFWRHIDPLIYRPRRHRKGSPRSHGGASGADPRAESDGGTTAHAAVSAATYALRVPTASIRRPRRSGSAGIRRGCNNVWLLSGALVSLTAPGSNMARLSRRRPVRGGTSWRSAAAVRNLRSAYARDRRRAHAAALALGCDERSGDGRAAAGPVIRSRPRNTACATTLKPS
jgi:hypothetical protein